MTTPPKSGAFYDSVPVFDGFSGVLEPSIYRPVPDNWIVGLSDVTGSTRAIGAGKYKSVNMAGAAVIAAVSNALGQRVFPFVFGGDGASFAVAPEDGAAARTALAATSGWVRGSLDLELRVGAVTVAEIRQAGHDVRVARFAVTPDLSYAMFSGGGLAFAETRLKEGAFAIAPGPADTPPDLTGLSCRWEPILAAHDVIMSLIVMPARNEADPAFHALVDEIVTLSTDVASAARPVSSARLREKWPADGLALEAQAVAGGSSLGKLRLGVSTWLAHLIFKFGLKVGGFDPAVYRQQIVDNSDFRKYGDGLRMTIDCTHALAGKIRARLDAAVAEGTIVYGLHEQTSALMTCIVPSALTADHLHFVDGADGGYAAAASKLKASLAKAAG